MEAELERLPLAAADLEDRGLDSRSGEQNGGETVFAKPLQGQPAVSVGWGDLNDGGGARAIDERVDQPQSLDIDGGYPPFAGFLLPRVERAVLAVPDEVDGQARAGDRAAVDVDDASFDRHIGDELQHIGLRSKL